MTKILGFLKKHCVLFLVLIFLPLYHMFVVNNGMWMCVGPETYAYHAVDYSMGFCNGFLPGAVYGMLVGVYNETAVNIYLTVLYFVFILIVAFLAEKFAAAFPEYKAECFILSFIFLTGPFSVGMFAKQFGMLDFYWALLFACSILFLRNKILKYALPVLAALMIITHYGALLSYVAVMLLILLFEIARSADKKDRTSYLVIFCVTLFLSVGLTLYFLVSNESNLVYPVEVFDSILRDERGVNNTLYYDFYCYGAIDKSVLESWPEEMQSFITGFFELFGSAKGSATPWYRALFESVSVQIQATMYQMRNRSVWFVNLIAIIPQIFLYGILISYIKKADNLLKKITTVLMMLLSVIIELVGILFSIDNTRWLGNSIILLFVYVLYTIRFDYPEGMTKIRSWFSKKGYGIALITAFVYSCIVVDPYTAKVVYNLI